MNENFARNASDKAVVAPGWVEIDRFVPASDRHEARYELDAAWHTDLPIFFTLRRLENRMGLETLIEATRKLVDQGIQFRTLIGGGGSLKSKLQEMIDDLGLDEHVFLLGRLPEKQLAACYSAADCFVLPTRALECFGLIVLEAFSCNTPVIASNVAAIPELAKRQGEEWMFEAGNSDQLARRMASFVGNELPREHDLRSIAAEYTKPKVLKTWENLLVP